MSSVTEAREAFWPITVEVETYYGSAKDIRLLKFSLGFASNELILSTGELNGPLAIVDKE